MTWRKFFKWTVAIFALYAVYRAPEQSAEVVRTVWGWTKEAAASTADFFNGVLS